MGRRLRFWAIVWPENGKYVAYEPTTGVASQGSSIDEAVENLREAVELYLEEAGAEDIAEIPSITVTRFEVETPTERS